MRIFVLMISLLQYSSIFTQNDASINLLVTEDSWRKEAFQFPKPFAPEVDLKGVADVRFTKGWGDVNSPNYWSYAFAWKIDLEERLSDAELEKYQELYFDGLMNVVNRDTTVKVPATNALFVSSPSEDNGLHYKGKIKLYDAFFKNQMITLNINGQYRYCTDSDKHIYIIRLSPQPLENEVWDHVNKTELQGDVCKP